jgi:RimJ/RimL family protein N-acetyltransferase
VVEFVADRLQINRSPSQVGIGLEVGGDLIAGVLYDDFNKSNVWMHVAAVPGKRWLNREFLWFCFQYPFIQLGVKRASGWVEVDNMEARRFDEHLGFKAEAVLEGAGRNGQDVIIYRMWRHECRFIKGTENVEMAHN